MILCQLVQIFFRTDTCSKLNNFKFYDICGYKKGKTTYFCCWIHDPRSGMDKKNHVSQDKNPGSATLDIALSSVADPDPGSGAFLTPGSGMG